MIITDNAFNPVHEISDAAVHCLAIAPHIVVLIVLKHLIAETAYANNRGSAVFGFVNWSTLQVQIGRLLVHYFCIIVTFKWHPAV